MTDETVPEHTLALLRRIDAKLDRVNDDVTDIKTRMTSVEQQLGYVVTALGGQSERIDRLDARLARMERRDELIDD